MPIPKTASISLLEQPLAFSHLRGRGVATGEELEELDVDEREEFELVLHEEAEVRKQVSNFGNLSPSAACGETCATHRVWTRQG